MAGSQARWGDYAIGEKIDHVDGITVEDATWDKLKALATDYGLAAELDLK